MSFQVRCEIGVLLDIELEADVAFVVDNFLDTVVCFRPVAVVNIIVVVSRRRHRSLEEVRVDEHRSRRHEATT